MQLPAFALLALALLALLPRASAAAGSKITNDVLGLAQTATQLVRQGGPGTILQTIGAERSVACLQNTRSLLLCPGGPATCNADAAYLLTSVQ